MKSWPAGVFVRPKQERARGLEENRARCRGVLVRLHVEERGCRVRDTDHHRAPRPAAPRLGDQHEDSEERERGAETRELPCGKAAPFDCGAARRKQHGRGHDF